MNDTNRNSVLDPLSERELEILHLIEEGCTNRETAQRLVLSLETIKWYNKQIYEKLGVHNRTQAVTAAKAAGLLGIRSQKPEHPAVTPRHNLPAQLTSFIGREREIVEILELLATNRLLTLTGPPGTGKTRLALQVALQILYEFNDGVYFVELAPINDPRFVLTTIAQVFDLGETGAGSVIDNLKRYLGGKRVLLVLDNFEQIIETAPLVNDLLSAAPGLIVLVTSRQALQIYGEQEYLVPPLSVPGLGSIQSLRALSQYESVELFCQRAHAVNPDFDLSIENAPAITEICIRLDGLPLAIELAAARSKLLSPEMIRDRLESRLETLTGGARDLPSRFQTLRSTIDWSYDLLTEGEKVLFARLSVFQGGRTIESAEAICGPGLSISVIDGLESLLNKSLLYRDTGSESERRFMMLETIHEYAREKLTESSEAEQLQRKHAFYFTRFAEQAEKELLQGKQKYWFERLLSEHDNLRTALAFTQKIGECELGLRIEGALRDFWNYSGHAGEGLGWIERTLQTSDQVSPAVRAKALIAAGEFSFLQGNFERGKLHLRKAEALCRELGDQVNLAWALAFLSGNYTGLQNDIKEGMALCQESLALFRTQNDKPGIIRSLNLLGELSRLNSDYDQAGVAYEECLALCRQSDDRLREAYALANSGTVALHRGDYHLAELRMRKALVLFYDLKNIYPLALTMAFFAGPIVALGNPERAAQLLGASDGFLKAMGLRQQPSDQPEIDRYESTVRQQLSEEAFKAAWEKGQAMSLEQAIAFALEETKNR